MSRHSVLVSPPKDQGGFLVSQFQAQQAFTNLLIKYIHLVALDTKSIKNSLWLVKTVSKVGPSVHYDTCI
jgi:hypothetical protein